MTQTAPARPAPRANADYRWTLPKAMAFLNALAGSGKVAEAARMVGMSRQSAYRLKHRLTGTPLERGWGLGVARGAGGAAQARRAARPLGRRRAWRAGAARAR